MSSGEAAKALGIHLRTLQQWAHDGLIKPHLRTPGGHARWDVERLRRELLDMYEEQRQAEEDR